MRRDFDSFIPMNTPFSFLSVAPQCRYWEQRMVFPVPGSPRTRTTRPSGIPPPSMLSRPSIPEASLDVGVDSSRPSVVEGIFLTASRLDPYQTQRCFLSNHSWVYVR